MCVTDVSHMLYVHHNYGVLQSDRVNDLCDFQYNQYKFLPFYGNFRKQNSNQISAGYLPSSWLKNPIKTKT